MIRNAKPRDLLQHESTARFPGDLFHGKVATGNFIFAGRPA